MTEERIKELIRVTKSICSCIPEGEALCIGSVVGELISEIRNIQDKLDKLTSEEA